ncbi:hypothetical protein F3Y22_tig00113722pilonHSYRG00280 [Hibiscus syriacus]|uniref:Uncharacterized protein n=1 Tax=Hibiscus syriacus TaxID=106335 RepID=A0A6A2WN58_HIBSY|nr:hypothetical protein F3Y22_tig00113722pilonHSYRG00280 [Hibiscus syriacus]
MGRGWALLSGMVWRVEQQSMGAVVGKGACVGNSQQAVWDHKAATEITKDCDGFYKVLLKNHRGASAKVSLHGGLVTSWRNEQGEELLFTSSKIIEYFENFRRSLSQSSHMSLRFNNVLAMKLARMGNGDRSCLKLGGE